MTLDVECHRCGYAWKYTGSSEYYASCPQCKTSVPIEESAGEGQTTGSEGAEPAQNEPQAPDGDDLDVLATRIEELESTASGLHDAIEAMMARVTDLEKRHDAIATVGDGGTVADRDDRSTAPQTPGGDGVDRRRGGRDGRDAEGAGTGRSGPDRQTGTAPDQSDGTRTSAPSDGRSRDGRSSTLEGSAEGPSEPETAENHLGPTHGGDTGGAPGLEPIPDDEGNYDYLCPSCDGSLSGRPDVCLHCGASFDW